MDRQHRVWFRILWLGGLLWSGVLLGGMGCQCGGTSLYCSVDADCASVHWRCVKGVCVQIPLYDGSQDDGGGGKEDVGDLPPPEPCLPGQTRPCSTVCGTGSERCIHGRWDGCTAPVPTVEFCDGKDNNCNGTVDEGNPGGGKPCVVPGKKGACAKGQTRCVSGKVVCRQVVAPSSEKCNDNIDNDCDGSVDEGCSTSCVPNQKRPCYTGPAGTQGKGICKGGTQTCLASKKWSACAGQVVPRAEVCDKLDNNCNGQIDESFPQKNKGCVVPGKKGECAKGKYVACSAGKLICSPLYGPVAEKCGDGLDNDCDGAVDEGCKTCVPGQTRSCYEGSPPTLGKGECKTGSQTCNSNKQWGSCLGQVLPSVDICGDKKDNDCDGKVDETCSECQPGQKKSCYTGPSGTLTKGICKSGIQTCLASGKWGACAGQVLPAAEVCGDKKDNNCNGKVDETCTGCTPNQKRSCYTGPAGTLGKGLCKAGTQTCLTTRKWGPCVGQVLPVAETCNGKDDDCDGYTDEAFPQQGTFCKSSKPGICSQGIYNCYKGTLQCLPMYQPHMEICNGKDDDCNGKIDDGIPLKTFYRDADKDNYGDPKVIKKGCLVPSGYVTNNLDCYDKNKNVHPRQTGFFSTHRGDGSFDYNCNGKEEKRFTKVGSCKGCTTPVFDEGFLNPNPACGKSGKWVTACRFDVGKCYPITQSRVQQCR